MNGRMVLVVAAIALAAGALGCGGSSGSDGAGSGRLIKGGAELQAQRLELIQDLIEQGVFTKMDRPGTMLRVYTGRAWGSLTIDAKRDFVSVVYSYEYAGQRVTYADLIAVYDGYTGKKLGHMDGDGRLEL